MSRYRWVEIDNERFAGGTSKSYRLSLQLSSTDEVSYDTSWDSEADEDVEEDVLKLSNYQGEIFLPQGMPLFIEEENTYVSGIIAGPTVISGQSRNLALTIPKWTNLHVVFNAGTLRLDGKITPVVDTPYSRSLKEYRDRYNAERLKSPPGPRYETGTDGELHAIYSGAYEDEEECTDLNVCRAYNLVYILKMGGMTTINTHDIAAPARHERIIPVAHTSPATLDERSQLEARIKQAIAGELYEEAGRLTKILRALDHPRA